MYILASNIKGENIFKAITTVGYRVILMFFYGYVSLFSLV